MMTQNVLRKAAISSGQSSKVAICSNCCIFHYLSKNKPFHETRLQPDRRLVEVNVSLTASQEKRLSSFSESVSSNNDFQKSQLGFVVLFFNREKEQSSGGRFGVIVLNHISGPTLLSVSGTVWMNAQPPVLGCNGLLPRLCISSSFYLNAWDWTIRFIRVFPVTRPLIGWKQESRSCLWPHPEVLQCCTVHSGHGDEVTNSKLISAQTKHLESERGPKNSCTSVRGHLIRLEGGALGSSPETTSSLQSQEESSLSFNLSASADGQSWLHPLFPETFTASPSSSTTRLPGLVFVSGSQRHSLKIKKVMTTCCLGPVASL